MLCCCRLLQQEIEKVHNSTRRRSCSLCFHTLVFIHRGCDGEMIFDHVRECVGKVWNGKECSLTETNTIWHLRKSLIHLQHQCRAGLCVNTFHFCPTPSLFCKRADWSRANPSGFPQAPSCFKPGYLAFPHIAGCRAICGLWHNIEEPQTWPPQSHCMLHRASVGALSYLMWTLCHDCVDWTPSTEPLGLMTPWSCFAVTAASSWKVKASSRTRLQCVPPTNPTRWPARGCRRWRRTAGAALPLRSNLEPRTQVRNGWRF